MYAVDWKLSTTISKVNTIGRHLSADCLQRCDFTLVIILENHDVRRGSKLSTTISKVNTIGRHLSADCLQRCDNELLHSLKKKSDWWKPWCTPWFEIICHDIQVNTIGRHLSADCLQRCDDELLHSLKKSLTGEYHDVRRGSKLSATIFKWIQW